MASNEDVSRPITLYVEQFEFDDIDMEYLHRKRVTVMDVEMSLSDARELARYLQTRLNGEMPGTIRVRIRGLLSLG